MKSENLLATPFGVSKGTIGKLYSENISPYSPKKKERLDNIANYCLKIVMLFIALTL